MSFKRFLARCLAGDVKCVSAGLHDAQVIFVMYIGILVLIACVISYKKKLYLYYDYNIIIWSLIKCPKKITIIFF